MNQLSLLDAPPLARKMPQGPIVRSAEIEGPYRWVMHRAWSVAGPTIVWVLLNPSDADGKRDDPTTLRMIGFSFRWGFGSMVVANLYPFVSSTTDKLKAWRKTFDWKTYEANGMRPWGWDNTSWSAFHHNIEVVSKYLTEDTVCVAAWGAGAPEADVDQLIRGVRAPVENDFGNIGVEINWHCLGKTADGSPIHPLARGRHRVPDDAVLQMWKRRPRRSPERSGCV